MMKKRKKIAAVFLSVMMALTACGNGGSDVQEAMASVEEETEKIEDEAVVEDKAKVEAEKVEPEEKKAEEVDTEEIEEKVLISYYIENELEFHNELSVETQAVRTNVNDENDMEVADAVWTLENITIEAGEEENTQIIIVESTCSSYYWTDRKDRQMYSIVLPVVRYCDLNTGQAFPNLSKTGDMELGYIVDDVKWDEITYKIDYNGSSEWDDDGDWTFDEKSGGYVHPTTVYYEDKFVIGPQGYDSLGMIIVPLAISDMEDREDGVHEDDALIKDVLDEREDCYLYSVMDMYAMLNEDVEEDSAVGSDTTPKQGQAVHTHSYASSVTKNPTCTEEGVRTYICSCGSSYTEAIPASGHQWITTTETVSHPSAGHFGTVTETTYSCMNMNICGYNRYGTWEEFEAHCKASEEAWEAAHADFDWDGTSEQILHEMSTLCTTDGFIQRKETKETWIVDSEGWEETVTVNKCSVCGINQ